MYRLVRSISGSFLYFNYSYGFTLCLCHGVSVGDESLSRSDENSGNNVTEPTKVHKLQVYVKVQCCP